MYARFEAEMRPVLRSLKLAYASDNGTAASDDVLTAVTDLQNF